MTAFALKLSDATFTSSLRGIRLPSREKLVAEYLLGVSEAESIKNRADASAPLTVQGVPTYNAASVTVRSSFTTGYGFKSGLIPADDATIIVVRKNDALGANPFVVGDRGNYIGMHRFAGNNYAHNGELADNQGASRVPPGAGVIYFEALVRSAQNPQRATGGLGKMYYYSAGVQQVATSANQNLVGRRAQTQLCIGSDSLSDSVNNNTIEVYFVAMYQRPLSAVEIDAAYDAIVAYYAARGVTVV
jgi:hypothetical protein